MRKPFTAGALVATLLGVVTTLLMGTTFVLGLFGNTGVSTWTGTIGAVLLATWLLVINGKRRPRRAKTPRETTSETPPATTPETPPLPETART
jgi:hypothetical protein